MLPPFIAGLSSLILGLFIFLKNKLSALNRSLSLLFFCITIWQFGNLLSWSSNNPQACISFYQLQYVGVIFLSAATYHFSVEFNELQKQKGRVSYVYFFCTLLLLFLFHKDFIVSSREVPWGRHVIVGTAHNLFLFLWSLPFIFACFNLYRGYRATASPFERQRKRYVLLCFSIGCLGSIDYIPNYGIEVPYPLGFIFPIILVALTTYAIVQYRLLAVTVILKKATLITALCVIAGTCIYVTPFYMRDYLYNIWGSRWIFFPISIAFLWGLGLFYLIKFLRHMEELEFFKKFAYRPLLKKAAERASAARSINEFLIYLTREISSRVRLDYTGIMVWDNRHREFALIKSHTRSKKRNKISKGLALTMDDALVVELLRKRKILVYSELKYYLDTQLISPDDRIFAAKIIDTMKRFGAEIAVPCFCEDKLLAIVNMGHKLNPNDTFPKEDLELFTSLSNNVARAIHGFMLKQEKIKLIVASQHILISAIEAKDSYTRGHTDRVARYSCFIGKKLEKELRQFHHGLANLNWAAELHDLGKIGIPDKILLKKSKLNEEEMEIVRRHTVDGVKIIEPMREWLGDDICAGVQHHHENFDGTGYPSHQQREGIHLFARIIRIADAYDAMTSARPYRPALSKEEAIAELNKYKDTFFDPKIVDATVELCNQGVI
jgi:HD-GYP domain-containing protein (c-di-GMP phosphodiesterase class II)